MLPFSIVKLLSGRHEFPLHADLVVLLGTAALIKLYLHHFGESPAILVGRRGRMLGLREGVGLVGQGIEWEIIGVDLLDAVGDDVVEGFY